MAGGTGWPLVIQAGGWLALRCAERGLAMFLRPAQAAAYRVARRNAGSGPNRAAARTPENLLPKYDQLRI